MREAVQYVSLVLWFPLILLVIASLLRGGYKRYPFLFAYAVAAFLTAVVEMAARVGPAAGTRLSHSWATYYWIDDGIRQGLLFTVVISLLYRATRDIQGRALTRLMLLAGAIVVASTSFLIHYHAHTGINRWMTLWIRDLDFSSAILDLALWTILLNSRKYDTELFMVSGALGIRFTGEAIGHALRNEFRGLLLPADTTVVLASLTCLYIWWQVFRTSPVRKASRVGSSEI